MDWITQFQAFIMTSEMKRNNTKNNFQLEIDQMRERDRVAKREIELRAKRIFRNRKRNSCLSNFTFLKDLIHKN